VRLCIIWYSTKYLAFQDRNVCLLPDCCHSPQTCYGSLNGDYVISYPELLSNLSMPIFTHPSLDHHPITPGLLCSFLGYLSTLLFLQWPPANIPPIFPRHKSHEMVLLLKTFQKLSNSLRIICQFSSLAGFCLFLLNHSSEPLLALKIQIVWTFNFCCCCIRF
jgi:hypothetical protein